MSRAVIYIYTCRVLANDTSYSRPSCASKTYAHSLTERKTVDKVT